MVVSPETDDEDDVAVGVEDADDDAEVVEEAEDDEVALDGADERGLKGEAAQAWA